MECRRKQGLLEDAYAVIIIPEIGSMEHLMRKAARPLD